MIYIYKYTLNTLIYDNYQSKLSVSHLSISRMFVVIILYHAAMSTISVRPRLQDSWPACIAVS